MTGLTLNKTNTMKNLYLLVTLLSISGLIASQNDFKWKKLDAQTSKDIKDIYFQSPDTGYIVGENYLFKKTTDGGKTWVDLVPPSTGEWPDNFGNIAGIDFHKASAFSTLDSILILVWEKGYHGVYTSDDGANYTTFGFTDSSAFCSIRGFSRLSMNDVNGYVNLITYGKNCNDVSTYANFYDGPFSISYIDSAFVTDKGSFTSADADTFGIIMGHENGSMLRFGGPFSTQSTIFLDTSGVSAVGYASNYTWYAATEKGVDNMYVSVDSGKTFVPDATFPQTFHYPRIHDFSFNSMGVGIAGATSNSSSGVIIHKDTSGWAFFQSAEYPVRAVKMFDNGVAYAAGDNGLVMKFESTTTSIDENREQERQLRFFPNPADNSIMIQAGQHIRKVKILSIQGRELKESLIIDEQQEIDISYLPSGIYLLEAESESGFLRERLVVY